MTEQGQPATDGAAAGLEPRAQLMALQGVANGVVRGMLRAPVLSRFAGERLVTLYVTGRKSGKQFTIPVAYTKQGKDLLIGTPFGWGRNLRTGEPLTIRLKGRVRQADVRVLRDEAEVVDAYETMCQGQQDLRQLQQDPPRRRRATPTRTTCTPCGGPAPAPSG